MLVTNNSPIANMQRINEMSNVEIDINQSKDLVEDITESCAVVLDSTKKIHSRSISTVDEIEKLIDEIKLWNNSEIHFTSMKNLRFCRDMIPILEKAAEQIVIDRKEIEENMNTIIDLSDALKEKNKIIWELSIKLNKTDKHILDMLDRREEYTDIGKAYVDMRKGMSELHFKIEEQKIQIEELKKQRIHLELLIAHLSRRLNSTTEICKSLLIKIREKMRCTIL